MVVHRVAHHVDPVVLVGRHVLHVVILLVVVHRIHHVVHQLRYHVHRHQAVVHQLWKLVSQIRVCGIVIIRRLHIHVSILNSFVSILGSKFVFFYAFWRVYNGVESTYSITAVTFRKVLTFQTTPIFLR